MYHRNLIKQALRQRFVVMMPGGEGPFSGVLVDYDKEYWRFENCRTVPTKLGETAEDLPGRIWVKHSQAPAPYLQEITPEAKQVLGREV